jgi:hypothetical protein
MPRRRRVALPRAGLKIVAYYIENESGAALKRPELFRLLEDSHPSDAQLDRGGPSRNWLKTKNMVRVHFPRHRGS